MIEYFYSDPAFLQRCRSGPLGPQLDQFAKLLQEKCRCQSSLLTLFVWIDTVRGWWQHSGMPRKLRMEYPGAIYHVLNRGDRRAGVSPHY